MIHNHQMKVMTLRLWRMAPAGVPADLLLVTKAEADLEMAVKLAAKRMPMAAVLVLAMGRQMERARRRREEGEKLAKPPEMVLQRDRTMLRARRMALRPIAVAIAACVVAEEERKGVEVGIRGEDRSREVEEETVAAEAEVLHRVAGIEDPW